MYNKDLCKNANLTNYTQLYKASDADGCKNCEARRERDARPRTGEGRWQGRKRALPARTANLEPHDWIPALCETRKHGMHDMRGLLLLR